MRNTHQRHPCWPLLPSPSQTHRGRTTPPTRRPHGLPFPIGCSIHGCSMPRCPARLLLPSRPVLPPTSHHKHRLRRSLCGLSRVPSPNGEPSPHHRRRSRVREAILEPRCQRVRRTSLLVQYLLMRRPRPPWPGHRWLPRLRRLSRLPASHRPLHRQSRRRRLPWRRNQLQPRSKRGHHLPPSQWQRRPPRSARWDVRATHQRHRIPPRLPNPGHLPWRSHH